MNRRQVLKTAVLTTAACAVEVAGLRDALAQSRATTLLVLSETGPNALDLHAPGANRAAQALVWATFDRLIGFGNKTLSEGQTSYDYFSLAPELAENFQIAEDGKSVTFRLREGATFHSGNPVTVEDVKWSLDRAVSLPGFSKNQMAAGSLLDPKQFEIVEPRTIRVTWLNPDKLLMPDLAVAIPNIYDSVLLRGKATASDPWGVDYARVNSSGGGAFKVTTWKPGQETVLERFRDWKSGPQTSVNRIIIREVPSAASRRALIERGDADVLQDLPPKDFSDLVREKKIHVVATPMANAWRFLGMNTTKKPFDDKRVRQAVAYAVPYEDLFTTALYGRGRKLWGGPAQPAELDWPTPSPYVTDLARAKALLTEAGYPNGFETSFFLDISQATLHEPIGLLLQEGLGRIGIKVTLEKVPPGQLRGKLANKELPFFVEDFGAWFADPGYFFFLAYHGSNGPWNSASYIDADMTRMIDRARTEQDSPGYADLIRAMFTKAFEDVPFIPLIQPFQDVALKEGVSGHRYIFHRQLEYRFFAKT